MNKKYKTLYVFDNYETYSVTDNAMGYDEIFETDDKSEAIAYAKRNAIRWEWGN